jgi:hypothetical protein
LNAKKKEKVHIYKDFYLLLLTSEYKNSLEKTHPPPLISFEEKYKSKQVNQKI